MTKFELRTVAILAGIFALRMLGLCMLLPVFATEASQYTDANALLIGLAAGVYGLSQAVLQIPFGALSDKYGRKPMIVLGLVFIVLGSLIAAGTSNIYGLIIGRILQGCGAIGSVVIALLADQVREQVRASAMAILGASLGVAFALALILGPWLNLQVGLSGIFAFIAILGLLGLLLLYAVSQPQQQAVRETVSFKKGFKLIINNGILLRLNFGVFALHASLAALFLVIPGLLQRAGIVAADLWRLYLWALVLAMLAAWRLIKICETRQNQENLQLLAILGLLLAEVLLYTLDRWLGLASALVIFFTAFCFLEASLPTLVSKYAPDNHRGTALGMYSCLQFLGMFVGGVVGGWLQGQFTENFSALSVIVFCMVLAIIWVWLQKPRFIKILAGA